VAVLHRSSPPWKESGEVAAAPHLRTRSLTSTVRCSFRANTPSPRHLPCRNLPLAEGHFALAACGRGASATLGGLRPQEAGREGRLDD